MSDFLMNTYARLPVMFERGEGVFLWDTQGKKYLDAISGIAVCSLGHARRELAEAVNEQMQTLVHTSNLYQIGHQETLGKKLCELSGMEQVFFGNSGAEANEAAIKLARLYGKNKNIEKPEIIVANQSFHGRTMATLSATGNRKVQAGFAPLVSGFVRVDYNDVAAIEKIAEVNRNVVAILVEPVQGEGGVNIPDANYLNELRRICDENDWLLILDEIQTGMCRTGEWFAFQHNEIQPDVITLAKALGNGVPIGACLAGGKACDVLIPGTHGSTFGGNPLACRAALEVIAIIEGERLAEKATLLGQQIREKFENKLAGCHHVKSIRNKGLMIGVELDRACGALVGQALDKGLLINVAADNTVRLLPPLTLSETDVDQITDTVSDLILAFDN